MKLSPGLVLGALVGLFFGPLLLAWLLYFGPIDVGPLETLPNPDRELFANPVSLPRISLSTPRGETTAPDWARYRWTLIYARIAPCEGECVSHLRRLTQVYLALGRDRDRVQRVFLTTGMAAQFSADSELLIGRLDDGSAAGLVDLLGEDRIRNGRFFVVDPLGNLILSYPPDTDQRGLLDDLERLLDVSRVG